MSDVVVFDLGGVVCQFDPGRRLTALSAATGLSTDQVRHAIWDSGLDRRCEAGDLTTDRAFNAILEALGRRLDPVTLRAAWSQAFLPDDSVCQLMNEVQGERYIFTNNGPLVTDCFAHELQPVSLLVRRVICSWEVRVRKPDPIAFDRLAEELRHPPSEITFIDDALVNCESAESVGMHAVLFKGEPALRDCLGRLGLLSA